MTMTATRPARAPQRPMRRAAIGRPSYIQTLGCIPASAPLARMSVRTTMACWGLDDIAEDAALVATELVTNAIRHRPTCCTPEEPGRCRLTVEQTGPDTVRISVTDSSGRMLVRRNPTADDETGRGLSILDALADRWAMEPLATGKRVWAEIRNKP